MSDTKYDPDIYSEFKRSVDIINNISNQPVAFPLERFKQDWLDRFLNDKDTRLRRDWVESIAKSFLAVVYLTDENNQAVCKVPAMTVTKGNYIKNNINMEEFIRRYTYAKNYANGARAIAMMNWFIDNHVEEAEVNKNDIKDWLDFYAFFNVVPEWAKRAKSVLGNEASNNDANSVTATGFDHVDEFEDL